MCADVKTVIVTGSRKYKDYDLVRKVLDGHKPDVLLQGGCRGADSLAYSWCFEKDILCLTFQVGKPCPISGTKLKGWEAGKVASKLRDEHMLKLAKLLYENPVVIAFHVANEFPGSETQDCVNYAKNMGLQTEVYLAE